MKEEHAQLLIQIQIQTLKQENKTHKQISLVCFSVNENWWQSWRLIGLVVLKKDEKKKMRKTIKSEENEQRPEDVTIQLHG